MQEHEDALKQYSDTLNSVWKHMHNPDYEQGKFTAFLDDANTAYFSADESGFHPVDFSFLNEPFLKKEYGLVFEDYTSQATDYPVAFPDMDDIKSRMEVLSKTVKIGSENNRSFLLCKQTFKASNKGAGMAPTLTKCLYFAQEDDDDDDGPQTNILAAACLSFELSSEDQYGERRPVQGRRHAMITMTVGPDPGVDVPQEICDFPFMVGFNTRKPEVLFMIGEDDFYPNQQVEVNEYERARLDESGKPTPVFRSLGKSPELDRFMPIPHLRMYMSLPGAGDVPVIRWELLGHIGDLLCAYAVHLEDGSMDCLLVRSRMVQFDIRNQDLEENEIEPEPEPEMAGRGKKEQQQKSKQGKKQEAGNNPRQQQKQQQQQQQKQQKQQQQQQQKQQQQQQQQQQKQQKQPQQQQQQQPQQQKQQQQQQQQKGKQGPKKQEAHNPPARVAQKKEEDKAEAPPPPSWTKDKDQFNVEFPVLSIEEQKKKQKMKRQGLVFEDVGEDDYDLDMRAMMLGHDFDLGGFSSDLEDEEEEEEDDEKAFCHAAYNHHQPIFGTGGSSSSSSIWGAAATATQEAKPWARSWLRPVMRGGD